MFIVKQIKEFYKGTYIIHYCRDSVKLNHRDGDTGKKWTTRSDVLSEDMFLQEELSSMYQTIYRLIVKYNGCNLQINKFIVYTLAESMM